MWKVQSLIGRLRRAEAGQADFVTVLIIIGIVLVVGALAYFFLVPALHSLFGGVANKINNIQYQQGGVGNP